MNREATFQTVLELFKPFVKNEAGLANATESTSILDDLKVNSARLVDIILAMEDEFEIEIDDDSADKVRTVKDAVDLIIAKSSNA